MYRENHAGENGDHSCQYSAEHVKGNYCFDNAAMGFSCVAQWTENQKEYQKGCDSFQGTYKYITKDGNAGCTGGCNSKDGTKNQTDDDSFYQCNPGPFVP